MSSPESEDDITGLDLGPPPVKFVGGQIARYVSAWKQISSDPWLLRTVQGVEIPFVEIPIQEKEPYPYRLAEDEMRAVDEEIEKFREKDIVEEVQPELGQVLSNLFVRPKKDGGFRVILDLTWVNLHVEYKHFKMTSLQTALNMMRRDCWMGSIDLKDAYYSVPVVEHHRKFLRFKWNGRLFQFKVMPNGLACAPRFFTKILSPVFSKLREGGLEGFPYIDDSFVVSDTEERCTEALKELGQVLTKLGFVVHPVKSVFIPTKQLVFLGFILDSESFKVYLVEDKEDKFIRAARELLAKHKVRIREVAGLIGLMTAFAQGFVYANSHIKSLEREKIEALARERGNFEGLMIVSADSKREIHWWLENIRKSGRPIRERGPDLTIYTDASNEGWGAHTGSSATGGRWSEEEKSEHINVLELRAVQFGLESLCEEIDSHIRIMTDNTTAMAYINHQGGVRSDRCDQVAKEIWGWAEFKQNWLSAAHIPGVDNVLADWKSRNFQDNSEWSLSDGLYNKVVNVFGQPEIDLFATRLNCKVERYVSWQPDPFAYAIDAFVMSWSKYKFYAFPPFSLVGQVIEKALEDEARGVLIVPWWPSQPWWGRLVNLNLRHLRFRPKRKNLVPQGNPENIELIRKCPLGVFLFWGNPC